MYYSRSLRVGMRQLESDTCPQRLVVALTVADSFHFNGTRGALAIAYQRSGDTQARSYL